MVYGTPRTGISVSQTCFGHPASVWTTLSFTVKCLNRTSKESTNIFSQNPTGSDVSVPAFQATVDPTSRPEGGAAASSKNKEIKLSAILINNLNIMETDELLVFVSEGLIKE
ncbi:hypothetical protein XENORESO_004320 [Xenotaenia resolanae]|uniref:Uncharacterized protein n=1 Tax=Xenotaenia resolanae TaxID=208358 RepID=A0ABV0WD01_9TELE